MKDEASFDPSVPGKDNPCCREDGADAVSLKKSEKLRKV
jgi:hypothetical protein